jgi:Rod binding domain-containing protein
MKIAGLPSPTDKATSPSKTQEVAESFSSLFLETMLQAMRKTVPKSGFMDGGNSEEIYRSMLDAEYAKIMSQTSGKSLSTMISKQIMGLQKEMDKNKQLNGYREAAKIQSIPVQQELPISLLLPKIDNQ